MNMLGRCYSTGIALALALLLCSFSQGPAQTGGGKPAEKKVELKSYTFEMRAKPWITVFEWLTDKTDTKFISNNAPSGTFNFIGPKDRKYTIPEIIDIINDGLISHKWVLLNRGTSFTLVPADEKIDPALLARIDLAELPEHGKTEIVSTVYQCTALVAEDSAPEVKKQMGPFGEVVVLHKANQLILQDTIANLMRIKKELDAQEAKEATGGQSADIWIHQCIYVRASKAEAALRGFLGDPRQVTEVLKSGTTGVGPGAGGGKKGKGGGFGGGFDISDVDPLTAALMARGGGFSQPQPATQQRVRSYTVTSDDQTNKIFFNGPADKKVQAQNFMKEFDKGTVPITAGAPVLMTYPINAGNAMAIKDTLLEIHKGNLNIKIAHIGNNQLMVLAPPEDQLVIANQINTTRPPATKTEKIDLTILDALRTTETLKNMFPEYKNLAPWIEADSSRNAIIVKGTPDQINEVKMAINAIGESPDSQEGSSRRVISLDKGSAATLADALKRMFNQVRDNPVKVIAPTNIIPVKPETPETPPKIQKETRLAPQALSLYHVAQLTPAQDKDEKEKKSGDSGKSKPVTITAFGNKLIVESEDPQALKLVSELVRLLTSVPPGPGDFEIIRLKFANAVDTAKILDEIFNGPAQQGFGGFGGKGKGSNFGPGGAAFPGIGPGALGANPLGGLLGAALGGGAGGAQREDRIRVVADPATNALLVRASPLDMLTIRKLVENQLDAGVTDAEAVIKIHTIGPLKYAYAVDVAAVVRDVYRESMNNNLRGLGQINNPFTGATRAPTFNIDANGNPKGVTLSLGTDDKTNSLILACPTPMYLEIKRLVDQMEIAAKDTKQTVKIVQVKGVDPNLIQQAIDAIQGRTAATRPGQPTGAMGGAGGFGNQGGFGAAGGKGGNFGATGLAPGGIGGGFGGGNFGGGGFGGGNFTPGGGFGGGKGGGGFGGGGFGGGGGGKGKTNYRGPDFFEEGVMDDPEPILYDPRLDRGPSLLALTRGAEPFLFPGGAAATAGTYQPIQQVIYTAQEELPMPAKETGAPELQAPRLPVIVEALPELGVLVVRSNNPQDMALAEAIIDYVLKESAKTQVEITIIPLINADATSVTNTLTQLYRNFIIGPYSTTQLIGRPGVPTPGVGGVGFGGAAGGIGFAGAAGGAAAAQATASGSIVLIPVVRQNSILVGAPRSRMEDIKKDIARLDVRAFDDSKAVPIQLQRAAAGRVANLITAYFAQRYPNEAALQHQIRLAYDDGTNTIFVQAAPSDMADIRALIEHIDIAPTKAINDLRVVPLKSAIANDLALIINHAVTDTFVETTGAIAVPTGAAGGLVGGAGGLVGGAAGLAGGAGGLVGAAGAAGAVGQLGTASSGVNAQVARQTKVKALRLGRKDGTFVESGIFEDVRITSDPRTNSLIIDAPPKTMELILALIREMDVPPQAVSNVQVFTLRIADAVQTAISLQKLFLNQGTGTTSTTTTLGGTGATAGATALGVTQSLQFSITGSPVPGAPIIDLRIAVDERTNSLLAAGSLNDLEVIASIIAKLDRPDGQQRLYQVYKMQNALAADVAAAVTDLLTKRLTIEKNATMATGYQETLKDVALSVEPISNSLLISTSPYMMDIVLRLVAQLDVMPPQVMIQVMVIEVDITNSDEFGVQIGLQSPILFQRGQTSSGGTGDSAATLNQTLTAVNPGFNFNQSPALQSNNAVVNPSIVGYQGLNNLGVGLVSPINGVGGFVFSAASNSFNLLIRALAVQNRADILSRPQIMTLNNQTALLNVGRNIPVPGAATVSATGSVTQSIDRQDTGIILQVTPTIMPDGMVLMRIIPDVSIVEPTLVPTGNGTLSPVIDKQHLETTVSAMDGETVALGGLLSRSNARQENKIPILGDLPGVGALFRYRQQNKNKKELIFIMTPHVVRCRADLERLLADESRKVDFMPQDVYKMHGPFVDPLALGRYPNSAGSAMPVLPRTTNPRLEEVPAPTPVPQSAPLPAPVPAPPNMLPPPVPGAQGAAPPARNMLPPAAAVQAPPAFPAAPPPPQAQLQAPPTGASIANPVQTSPFVPPFSAVQAGVQQAAGMPAATTPVSTAPVNTPQGYLPQVNTQQVGAPQPNTQQPNKNQPATQSPAGNAAQAPQPMIPASFYQSPTAVPGNGSR